MGDPGELDRLADRLVERAQRVRQLASEHVTRAQAARWVSDSANDYRELVIQDRRRSYRCAEQLERAAARLRRHAAEVRETKEEIARIEESAGRWFGQQRHDAEAQAVRVWDDVKKAWTIVTENPPWVGWPIIPTALPPSGDLRWLEIGPHLRREGAL